MLFAATPKASMTSTILMETFQKMDEAGITQRGVDENGNTYCPATVIDGHISWMGKDFLRYVNDEETNWDHECQATEPPSADELRKRYKDSQFLTAGQVFGLGNGRLGKEVCDKVIRRNEARKE